MCFCKKELESLFFLNKCAYLYSFGSRFVSDRMWAFIVPEIGWHIFVASPWREFASGRTRYTWQNKGHSSDCCPPCMCTRFRTRIWKFSSDSAHPVLHGGGTVGVWPANRWPERNSIKCNDICFIEFDNLFCSNLLCIVFKLRLKCRRILRNINESHPEIPEQFLSVLVSFTIDVDIFLQFV